MKCNKCNSEWNTEKTFKCCPFCGESLIEKTTVPDENTSLGGVIKYIADRFGADIFRDKNKFLSVFNDLAPQMKTEKKLLTIAFDEKIPQIFIETTEQDRETTILRIKRNLEIFMNESAVDTIISAFSEAFGWDYNPQPATPQPESALSPIAEEALKKGIAFEEAKNYVEALKWYKIAYDNGEHKEAAHELGWLYYYGDGGVEDREMSFKYFKEAYDNGNRTRSAFWLGYCYYYGGGVETDLVKAKYYFEEAAKNGHKPAKEFLEENF